MTALLGLLAVAGYQNRDKLAELLGGAGQAMSGGAGPGRGMPGGAGAQQGGGAQQSGGLGGQLGQLGGGLGGAGAGGVLGSGRSERLERVTHARPGHTAQSWVRQGPNEPIDPPRLEQAIGPDVLDTLSKQTGLSREELLARLSRELPDAVDKYTPQGQLPL